MKISRITTAPLLALVLSACGGSTDAPDVEAPTSSTAEKAPKQSQEEESSAAEMDADEETSTDADEGSESAEEEAATDDDSAGDGEGSRENPYAVGDSFTLGDWDLVVNSVTLDGTDNVMAENEFNDPPGDGRQFVLVNMDATYSGDESGMFWIDFSYSVVGAGGNTFGSGMDDWCGSIPEDLTNANEQFPGSTESGNICMSVPSEQVDGSLLMLQQSLSFDDDRAFVALD